MADQFTAIIPAGGTFTDKNAHAVTIKALAVVGGETLLDILLNSLSKVPEIDLVVVVGHDQLLSICKTHGASWANDTGSLLGNVQAGLIADTARANTRIVVIAADMAQPKPISISAFLNQSSGDAQLTIPLISKTDFVKAYPGSPSTFVKLREGEFTVGSLLTAPAGLIADPPAAVAALLGNRKSQIAMAKALGIGVIWRFITGTLSIDNLENRISKLTGVKARAVRDCAADLALDIDDAQDMAYARSLAG